jgi:acyl-CoA synthetase (NDP forming)
VLGQAGVHVLDTIEELCDVLTVLSVLPRRATTSDVRVGVVVGVGGAAVIAVDEIVRSSNLRLAEPPLDVPSLGDPSVFPRAIHELRERCDVIVAVATSLAHDYERLASGEDDGIVFAHLSHEERFTPEQARRLAARGIPSGPSVQNACRALAIWAGPGQVAEEEPQHGRSGLLQSRILGRWLAPTLAVGSREEAIVAAIRLGGMVAVKAEGTNVEHRHEVGAVHTHLSAPDEIAAAYDAVAKHDQVVVQAMAPRGAEVLVSVVRDPELGPVPVCRSADGPIAVLAENVPAPLRELVDEMLEIVRADDTILGIECNPVVVHHEGVTVVDLLTYTR